MTAERIEYGHTTCTYSCLEKLEFPFDRFVGVTVSHDRTALVWGEGLSDDEKNSITDFSIKLGCKFIDWDCVRPEGSDYPLRRVSG